MTTSTMRMLMIAASLLTVPLLLLAEQSSHAKTASVIVTAPMRENAIRNVEQYEWARRLRTQLEKIVEPYMNLSDEQLWHLPPSQQMPRDSAVNRSSSAGCPACGPAHYNAPYIPSRWHVDVLNHPWQVQCRNCQVWLPTNDLAGYYQSALNDQSRFELGKGDPRLLAPDPQRVAAALEVTGDQPYFGHPKQWIDDGTGLHIDDNQWWIAAHFAFRTWQELINVVEAMGALYTITGQPRYAHKAGVLLDRIADLYPEMDYAASYALGMECSTGGGGAGRIQGRIWETFTALKLTLAYDYIYDDLIRNQQLASFASAMSRQYGTGDKSSPKAIAEHIENNLLLEFVTGINDRRIQGNAGFHQYAMTAIAVALDREDLTPRLLAWLFEPASARWDGQPYGGQIPTILHQQLGREGLSDEVGLGYASIPVRSFINVADLLRHYGRFTEIDLYRDFPKFRNGFTAHSKVRIADSYTPNWGDGNKTMNGVGSQGSVIPVEQLLSGYRAYRDPAIGQLIWNATGGKLDELIGQVRWNTRSSNRLVSIYDEDPSAIVRHIRDNLPDANQPFVSYNSGGYGLAVLQAPSREHRRGFALYYGRTAGHGHADRLAINGLAHQVNILPDMGYPTRTGTDPHRSGWTSHVISHNTAMVNDRNQNRRASYSGKTRLFATQGPLHVADVDGDPAIYQDVQTYRRTLIMVDVDERDSYALDLFQIRGGSNHRLIQNGPGPKVTHSGLDLIEQGRGTYAGPDVDYGEFYDGPVAGYQGSGFQYLNNVSKAQPASSFWIDWQAVEPRRTMPEDWQAHLRVHNLGPIDEIALADGVPPEYRGNPELLRYTLRTRYGQNLISQFVSILEPYGHRPFIQSAQLIEHTATQDSFTAIVEIRLIDGRRDLLLVRDTPGNLHTDQVQMRGRVGLVRYDADNHPIQQVLIAGNHLQAGSQLLQSEYDILAGHITGFDDSDPTDIRLMLDTALPITQGLAGRYIMVHNSSRSDASFQIKQVHDAHTLGIGSSSLVEGFVDPLDYSKGLNYVVSQGDVFTIPLSIQWLVENSHATEDQGNHN